jgi:hypothetical protein
LDYPNASWRQTWPAETRAPLIWENLNRLSEKYGLQLDIVYEGVSVNLKERYSCVYLWNETLR